ncbi:hydroxyacylglutathione hydrolase [Novimethylophilus kurashikiensis]|nr:hydroxyacylglutathione hydrolase [Novimethylophilus kurashikiensis]
MNIVPVPAFSDNYIWLITHGNHAAVVDPGDAAPVQDYLRQHRLVLSAILITHRHDDHVVGVPELLRHSQVPVYAPRHENLAFSFEGVGEGDVVTLPHLPVDFRVLDVPGHTSKHVAYYGGNSLFCGDTLFGCGCGRIFDGNTEDLYRSLQKLAALPDETQVYCTHEYTLANERFARLIDPDNAELMRRVTSDQLQRDQGNPTLPSTIAVEKATNPFLRCHTPAIRKAAQEHGFATNTAAEIFSAIRTLKNNY